MAARTKIIIAIIAFLLSVAIFGFLAHEVVQEKEDMFDSATFNLLAPYSNGLTISIMRIFSFFGSHLFLFPAHILLALGLVYKKRWQDAIIVSGVALSSYVIMLILKNYFQRDRPSIRLEEVINSFSFPSGHAFSSFVFAVCLIYLLWKTPWRKRTKYMTSMLLLLISATIGLSRIVLKVHYASDVIAGFCIALSWMAFVICLNAFSNNDHWKQGKVIEEDIK